MTESQSQARPNAARLVKDLMTGHAEWVGALSYRDSPSGALSCRQRLAEATTAEYREEANKLTVPVTKIANDGFASLQHPGLEKVSTA
jgi:hypothetical protein